MVRILGLDIGQRRIGVAVSDSEGRVATPVKVIAGPLSADPGAMLRLVREWEAEAIVIGLPLSLDGSEGPQAAVVRREADALARVVPVPVLFQDERLTTAEARRVMNAAGVSERRQRGAVDQLAATLLLQAFLDAGGADRIVDEESGD